MSYISSTHELAALEGKLERLRREIPEEPATLLAWSAEEIAKPIETDDGIGQLMRMVAQKAINKGSVQLTLERDAHLAEIEAIEAKLPTVRAAAAEERHTETCRKIGIPRKDIGAIRGGKVTNAMRAVADFAAGPKTILVLSGSPGSGKSFAASRFLCDTAAGNTWTTAKFLDVSTLARVSRYDEKAMKEIEEASALVIDDLGMEFDDKSGAFRSLLDAVINARYANALKTVITTNLDATAFKARYGERVADRIREVGAFVVCGGESLRRMSA